MFYKIIEFIVEYATEILTIGTATLLIINFIIKKMKRRTEIKMKREYDVMLNREEYDLILAKRAKEKEALLLKEAEELDNIVKLMTPETIKAFKVMSGWVKKLLKGRKEHNYGYDNDEVEELLDQLETEKEQ